MEIEKTPSGYKIIIKDDEVLYVVADKGLLMDGQKARYSAILIRKEEQRGVRTKPTTK